MKKTILYDRQCFLCRQLAVWVGKDETYSTIPVDKPSKLTLVLEDQNSRQEIQDQDAWEFILKDLPQLQSLQWLAQKLGFEKALMKGSYFTAQTLRKFCFHCKF